jgi:CubicO group peptidase (beta-lactamase class C family)
VDTLLQGKLSSKKCSTGWTGIWDRWLAKFVSVLKKAAFKGLLLVSVAFVFAYAAPSGATSAQQLDSIFADFTDHHSPGVAVLVMRNGRKLVERGYGSSNLRTGTAINAQTNFRLASCTKQFTAMAVMLLVHDGKLRYDEHLTDIFPDFPAYGKAITIRNLLNHTSGLPDYEELMDQASSGQLLRWTAENQIQDSEVFTLLKAQSHEKFAPGTKWSYSNSGYVVLGLIVAKVSGEPFEDFLSTRIFQPLKMRHTLAFMKGKNEVSNRAYGYSKEGETFKETDQSSTSATLGDGVVYSNLEDLVNWDNALEHHTLLSAAEMQPALNPVKLADGSQPHWASGPGDADPQAGKPVSYSFGWFLDAYKGRTRMWHYGDTTGFSSAIVRFPKRKLTIVLLSNRSNVDAAKLASRVADVGFVWQNR